MPFLLDTSTCSAHFKGKPLHTRIVQYGGQLRVSRLTCAELFAFGYRKNAKILSQIDDFLRDLTIIEFDDRCARAYGRLHAQLAALGLSMGAVDLMIAATALVNDLIVVTPDRHFDLIQKAAHELQLLDWLS